MLDCLPFSLAAAAACAVLLSSAATLAICSGAQCHDCNSCLLRIATGDVRAVHTGSYLPVSIYALGFVCPICPP